MKIRHFQTNHVPVDELFGFFALDLVTGFVASFDGALQRRLSFRLNDVVAVVGLVHQDLHR